MDVSIGLGSITASAGGYLEFHILPLTGDGSTYVDFQAGGPTLVATAQVTSGASAKVVAVLGITIPPGSFKIAIFNSSGATLASSGNSAYYRLYNYTDNG